MTRFLTLVLLSASEMTASFYYHSQDGRWTLDGDAPGATIEGRAEWRDSAVGGKALVFNGVDTVLTIPDVRFTTTSIAFWFFAADRGPMTLADYGLPLELQSDGSLFLDTLITPPGLWHPGQWTHVAVSAPGARLRI